jgi:hypothetical protein
VEKIVVMWRDIPAQVIIKKGRNRAKCELSSRFAKAIDRAAMRAGKGSSEAYMEDWRRDRTVIADVEDKQALAEREVALIEDQYSDELLTVLIKNKGVAGDK